MLRFSLKESSSSKPQKRAHLQNHKRQPSYSVAHAPQAARAPESKLSKVLRVLYVTHSARVRSVSAVHTKLPLACQ